MAKIEIRIEPRLYFDNLASAGWISVKASVKQLPIPKRLKKAI